MLLINWFNVGIAGQICPYFTKESINKILYKYLKIIEFSRTATANEYQEHQICIHRNREMDLFSDYEKKQLV